MYTPIKTVDINLNPRLHTPKVIIYYNIDYLINNFTEGYLEDNRIWTFCFDTTPTDKISDKMQDYNEVLRAFPTSNRVPIKASYIGNLEDTEGFIDQYIKVLFNCDEYEVVHRENKLTRLDRGLNNEKCST